MRKYSTYLLRWNNSFKSIAIDTNYMFFVHFVAAVTNLQFPIQVRFSYATKSSLLNCIISLSASNK